MVPVSQVLFSPGYSLYVKYYVQFLLPIEPKEAVKFGLYDAWVLYQPYLILFVRSNNISKFV